MPKTKTMPKKEARPRERYEIRLTSDAIVRLGHMASSERRRPSSIVEELILGRFAERADDIAKSLAS